MDTNKRMTEKEFHNWWVQRQIYLKKWATKPDFEGTWKSLAGTKNRKGEVLTESRIKTWCDNPNPQIECEFCGTHEPYEGPTNLWCPRCREYKGIIPYIPEWSNWG